MTSVTVREYTADDLDSMIPIWNEVIEEGIAFPQEDYLNQETAAAFFSEQSYCGVAADGSGNVLGLYILHPNNVGRCGHICRAFGGLRSGQFQISPGGHKTPPEKLKSSPGAPRASWRR